MKLFLTIALVLIILGSSLAGSRLWYQEQLKPLNAEMAQSRLVRIEPGVSAEEAAKILKDQNLIKSALAFRIYLYTHGISDNIQAGLYRLEPDLATQDIARRLVSGQTAVRGVTITSGQRLDQIKAKLAGVGYSPNEIEEGLNRAYDFPILKDKPANATLEGYLYPDTYVVELDTPLPQLIELILLNTEAKVTPAIRVEWASRGLDIHQGLTLASIVQKEVSDREDQRKVAQVFYKRLGLGMKLEADPTFEYGAALLGVMASPEVDSLYNTYLHAGLPPGPIATAELSAIEAVADPAQTNFVFFLSGKDGRTHFTDNEAKHKQNVEEFLR